MKEIVLSILLLFLAPVCFGQADFTASKQQEDAQLLWEALNELHPGLYRQADTASLKKDYEQLLSDLSAEPSPQESFLLFSEFTAKIKCGHTYVNPFNQRNKIIDGVLEKNVLLPFTFSIIDKLIVVEDPLFDSLQKHTVITHMNGVEVSAIIDSLTRYVKADGGRDKKKIKDLEVHMDSKFEYFDYYFPMVFKFQDNVILTYVNGKEEQIPLMNKKERLAAYLKLYPELDQSNYDALWSFRFSEEYAYLRLGTFVTWRLSFDWEEYLNVFFTKLEEQQISNLVIDIRGNEGGLSEVGEYLINKLANKKGKTVFRKPHLVYKKVSENVRPYVTTWSKRFYNTSIWTKKLNDTYRTIRFSKNKSKRIKRNQNAYNGNTYLLINESNSSATFILSEVCKENDYATLVGVETAGTKKGITAGQIFFLRLPNTRMEIDIPLIGRYPMSDLPDVGVKPDFWVEQTLEAYINGKDEQLEKVIELIDKQ